MGLAGYGKFSFDVYEMVRRYSKDSIATQKAVEMC